MGPKIFDCVFEASPGAEGAVGISAPADIDLEVVRATFKNCKTGIELRDPPTILSAIGLPQDTPINLLRETLEVLLATEGQGPKASGEEASRTRLFDWLGGIANATNILTNLVALSQNGFIRGVLDCLPR